MELYGVVQRQIAAALTETAPEEIRIPARLFACDCYNKGALIPDANAFGTVFCAPLVRSVTLRGNRLCFALTDAFYSAAVEQINAVLTMPTSDHGDVALNRMLRYARHGGAGCPSKASMQRALWLCAGSTASTAIADRAADAFLCMLRDESVAKRQSLLHMCGPVSSACAKLYAQRYR